MKLQASIKQFDKRGLGIVAVSADDDAGAQKMKKNAGVRFRVQSDSSSKLIQRFGVKVPDGQIAWASVFLVDHKGKVVWRALETIKDRVTPAQILEAADKLLPKKH